MTCPTDHRHEGSQWCYDKHGCRCTPCRANKSATGKTRRKLKAYGRFESRVDARGTVRRIQGLQALGWTQTQIGVAAGLPQNAVSRLLTKTWVTPATRDRIKAAGEVLVGRGPDEVVARHAVAKGWVSLYAWNNPDADDSPAQQQQTPLAGEELINEIDWLIGGGAIPEHVARTVRRTPYALERMAYKIGRPDLASFFHAPRKKAAA